MHYEEHPSKAARWSDGALEVLSAAQSADTTVWFAYESERPQTRWEGLLAQRLSDDAAVIAAIPYWVYDLALGDEVAVVPSAEGPLVATGPRRQGGNFTFRVVWRSPRSDQPWLTLMQELEPQGCWFDVRDESFLALSAPRRHSQAVADYLAAEEARGTLQYETGRTN